MLIDYGASPNAVNVTISRSNNRTCYTTNVLLAVMMPNSAELVHLLLDRGADQHIYYSQYRYSLYTDVQRIDGFETTFASCLIANLICTVVSSENCPIENDIIRKLELLVQYGADIDSHIKGLTLLQHCLQCRRRTQTAMHLIPHLLAHGADANRLDSEGNRPLHILTRHFLTNYQRRWPLALSINSSKYSQHSPLSSLIDLLIEQGANPDAQDTEGMTPLILLCSQPHSLPTGLLVKILLRNKVDVNIADRWRCTALHYTVGTPESVFNQEHCFRLQMLLNHNSGALDVNCRDGSGRMPLHLLLETHGSSSCSPHDISRLRQCMTKRRALVMLIQAGADVRARLLPPTISTPFPKGHSVNSIGSMEHGHGHGTVAEGIFNDLLADTPLHLACQNRDPALIDILLRNGAAADVNSVCRPERLMPLAIVISTLGQSNVWWNRKKKMIQLLLAAGANPTPHDMSDSTVHSCLPLSNACLQQVQ